MFVMAFQQFRRRAFAIPLAGHEGTYSARQESSSSHHVVNWKRAPVAKTSFSSLLRVIKNLA